MFTEFHSKQRYKQFWLL